ncbi:MAG: hypothetical protein GXO07_00290 [Crenarchaeota archaeon]|nr:hypothetical protein [Thermoproteota archaeon]
MIELILLWTFNTGWMVSSLATDGYLGAASYANCFYLLSWNDGNIEFKHCPGRPVLRAFESGGAYAFVTEDSVYVTDGTRVEEVKCNCTAAIPYEGGLVACRSDGVLVGPGWERQFRCTWLGRDGELIVAVGPEGVLYLDPGGNVVKVLEEGGLSAALCDGRVALLREGEVVVIGQGILWRLNMTYPGQADFSPDCQMLAVTDAYRGVLIIFNSTSGDILYEREFKFYGDCPVTLFAVAWKDSYLAVGRGDGWVDAFEVRFVGEAGR